MQDSILLEKWCYTNTLFKSPYSSGPQPLANIEIARGFQMLILRHLQDSEVRNVVLTRALEDSAVSSPWIIILKTHYNLIL